MENNTNDYSIKITGVSKKYRLGALGGDTLQKDLQSWWARIRGKEDPNTALGSADLPQGYFWALRDIDLTIRRGERVGIIGINGSGKSTLLKLLSRITAPTKGEIDINGRISSLLEVGTGFHREMTGRENIYMNGSILGMTKQEIEDHMEEIIDFSEVREFIDTPVKRYSSGMFVKLAFSVAAHLQSEIMIMDEVLAVGDVAFQQKCISRMRKAAEQEGRTVLYVSHNMETIRRLCDRCIVLSHGKVVFDGDCESAIAAYMDQSLGENRTDIDLTELERSVKLNNTGVRMTHLLLEDKIMPVYNERENLKLRLDVRSEKDMPGVAASITMRTEADVGLGTAMTPPFDLKCGENSLKVEMPLGMLMKGVMYVSIGICGFDDMGRQVPLDRVTGACKIELSGKNRWNVDTDGYVRLTDLKVENIGKITGEL